MNPVEITQGKSFKGLSQYLLHDEKEDTAERVGWTQTYNLADAPPDQAWRLMLATANSAPDLKAAAGIKKGKTPKNVVHHFSINFNPEDEVTPEIMQKAVDEALAVYDMEHHQALAVEHTDKGHRHVHVMVNLIDPDNGMSAATPVATGEVNARTGKPQKRSKLSNSQRRLSAWAKKFERDNGLVITEGRLANANKRAQGETVDAKRKPRNVYEREKEERGIDRRKDFIKRQYEDKARDIQQRTAELKEQCASEWTALKASYADEKDALRASQSATMKAVSARIKEERKSDWRDLFRKQHNERHAFDRDSNKLLHRLLNGAVTVREMVRVGKGFRALTGAFSIVQQRDVLMMRQDKERAALSHEINRQRQQEIEQVKRDFDRQYGDARTRFLSECDSLKSEQDGAWQEIKDAWKLHNSMRREALSSRRGQDRSQQRGQNAGRGRGMTP